MLWIIDKVRLAFYLVLVLVLAPFVWDPNHDGVRDE